MSENNFMVLNNDDENWINFDVNKVQSLEDIKKIIDLFNFKIRKDNPRVYEVMYLLKDDEKYKLVGPDANN